MPKLLRITLRVAALAVATVAFMSAPTSAEAAQCRADEKCYHGMWGDYCYYDGSTTGWACWTNGTECFSEPIACQNN